jgi:hypothetical protein
MNTAFARDVQGVGYLGAFESENLPTQIPVILVSDTLAYTSQFWIDHLEACQEHSAEMIPLLRQFFTLHFVTWLEIVASVDKVPSVARHIACCKVREAVVEKTSD